MILSAPTREAVLYVAERAAAKEGGGAAAGVVDTVLATELAQVAWKDGTAIAVFGAQKVRPTVWRMFCFSTDEFPKIILPLTRHLKRAFFPALFDKGAKVIEGFSRDPDIIKWMRLCGGSEIGTVNGTTSYVIVR